MAETTAAAERERPADGSMLKTALEILEASGDWIGGEELAHRLGLGGARDLRREVIAPLRCTYRVPVYSRPGVAGGYKLRVTATEHTACIEYLRSMGRDYLALMSIVRAEGVDVIAGQMVMEFVGGGDGRPAGRADQLSLLIDDESRRGRTVRWTSVLDHLLAVMAAKPEVYAEDIERIRSRFGGLFLPADRAAEIEKSLEGALRMLRSGGGGSPGADQAA